MLTPPSPPHNVADQSVPLETGNPRAHMTPDKIALLFYMAGSLCFLAGSICLWFK